MSVQLTSTLWLGIDGGGTKCCALIMDANGTELGRGLGGPANAFQNLQLTQQSILTATHLALRAAGLPDIAMKNIIAGVGLAGVNIPSVFAAMDSWQHPFKKMHLCTDLRIACVGAHNKNHGVVIVAGTGSCGYSLVNHQETIIGGHGFLLGDKGSGAWLGLEAIKSVLLASDHLGPQTIMSELISHYLQVSGAMIVDKLNSATPSDYAALAHIVLAAAQKQDDVAIQIIREGADYLQVLAEKLWQTKPERMSLIGGLSDAIKPWLLPSMLERLSAPIHQPEYGAVLFAQQQEKKS